MYTLARLVSFAFDAYLIVIIAQVASSWLIAFGVLNTNNPQAQNLLRLMQKLTDPLYKPLRKFIPAIGGIDVTPIIVILGLSFVKEFIISLLLGY